MQELPEQEIVKKKKKDFPSMISFSLEYFYSIEPANRGGIGVYVKSEGMYRDK